MREHRGAVYAEVGVDPRAGSRCNLKEVARMATIDADAHVVESEHTWDYMDPADRKYRPVLVAPDGTHEDRPVRSILDTGSARSYWLIDGKIRGLARTVLTARQWQER